MTQKIVMNLTAQLSAAINCQDGIIEEKIIDLTVLPEKEGAIDASEIKIGREELFIVGIPVYAGRVPNVLLPYLKRFKGDQTKAIIVAVYGNRHYDDALMELFQLLKTNGFDVIAAGAFIGEHSFSNSLAAGRPDADDLLDCNRFAQRIADKLTRIASNRKDNSRISETSECPEIPGNWPLRPYYKPVDETGAIFDFKRIVPITKATCIDCGLCANICPVQSISYVDHRTIIGICIKCCACVKRCPVNAKQFDDLNFIKHKKELETGFIESRSPECFL